MITITTQGALFNSPLHFIGFGRGNIVNSEVVQRLGTYYPIAGGVSKESRNLQLTSIDAPVGNGVGILDPEYTIWNNVTYADNYYQTLESPIAPHGKEIAQADWNVNLSSLAGFEQPGDKFWNPHLKTLAWYLGTTNVSLGTIDRYLGTNNNYSLENPFGSPAMNSELINRRLGDLYTNGVKVYEDAQTWYTPDHTRSTSVHGDNNSVWEGIGTGWFSSIAGGGSGIRPYGTLANKVGVSSLAADYFTTHRIDVSVDNTNTSRQRGDFAVPTVFNGNFDAITTNNFGAQLIPGWTGLSQTALVDINTIAGLEDYRDKLNITQPNYAIKLDPGNSITHNDFVLPEWGSLRFNVFAPTPADDSDFNSVIKVWLIDGDTPPYELKTHVISDNTNPYNGIDENLRDLPGFEGAKVNQNLPAVDLRRVSIDGKQSTLMQSQLNRLSYGFVKKDSSEIKEYGSTGFETFTVNLADNPSIPKNIYGKNVKIRFEVEGEKTAYVDDIYFQSNHLYLGNPTQAKYLPDVPDSRNFLLEMPGYSISYNSQKRTLNWASYEFNQTWTGASILNGARPRFEPNYQLPNSFVQAQDENYDNTYTRGHMVAASYRTRNYKEGYLTYSTANLLPQLKIGSPIEPWNNLENYERNLVTSGKELYIIAGGYGTKTDLPSDSIFLENGINVPERLWKVIVEMNPGENISDINESTRVIAVDMPNDGGAENFDWQHYYVSVNTLQDRLNSAGLNYDFFSNIQTNVRNQLKNREALASLLASSDDSSVTSFRTFNGIAIGRDSSPIEGVVEISSSTSPTRSISQVSSNQNGGVQIISTPNTVMEDRTTQINSLHIGIGEISLSPIRPIDGSIPQISFSEVSSNQGGIGQTSSEQSSTGQVRQAQIDHFQVSSTEVNFSQVDITQIGSKFPSGGTSTQIDPSKITFSSSIPSQQFLSSNLPNHLNTSELTNVESTAVSIWNNLLNPTTPINLTFNVTNLPTGQLAEATITGYDQLGRPNTATISIDDDANGVGWFLDTTPADNSEFTGTDTYFQATPNSPASAKYDLLTTILHEMGHTLGIINGYSEFNKYVKSRQFITDTFTANLTPDGSHLDTTFHPYDLMNTSLKPGVRKLPSALNLAMIDAINSGVGGWVSGAASTISAPLTAGALLAINNGDFSTTADWNTLGATNIINGTATLTEQSQKLSELTQAFIIPTGAKTLQFTIKDNHLVTGDTTKTANDAFEVALLDTNTFNPLAGTSIGLNHTDSLLNIQANGTIHKSDKVTITALGNNSSIVTIDLTQVAPSTQATLYFNLLGFGSDGQISNREHPTFLNGSKVLTVNLYIS